MVVNKKNEVQKEQGYLNLRAIHSLQVGGAIQSILRDLRSARVQAEHLAKVVNDKRKEFADNEKNKESVSVSKSVEIVTESKTVDEKIGQEVKSVESEVKPLQKQEGFVSDKKREFSENKGFKENRQDKPRQFQNGEQRRFGQNNADGQQRQFGQNGQRPQYNNGPRSQGQQYNNGPRPFSSNNQQNRNFGQRPQSSFQNSNGQRTQSSFQNSNGQRPYGQNGFQNSNGPRPFGQGGYQRPVGQRPSSTGFASSKGNNFKSFAPTESSSVLAQPERNFGNKNKSANKSSPEEKQVRAFKKGSQKNNFIIEDEEGFNETTMGSRKLVKKKKDQDVFVAPIVDNAVITTEEISVKILSEKTGRPVTEIIKKLMMLGIMSTINSVINYDTAELVCSELGVALEKKIEKTYEEQLSEHANNTTIDFENAVKRPPIVTVMGHVDHGKTSLLDAIRQTSVVSGEAGGITQHIGAYQVQKNGEKITFIDTPGHAAFTAMRARGAKATDIAILVVAADDGVMLQTIEAINHIKAAKVPMIVAINKIDKPDANIDKIKQQLSEHDVLPEEWGGDAVLVPVSAKTGKGIDELLSMVILVSDMQELKANPDHLATGVILEASLDKNKGPLATMLVQNGTLRNGDNIVCGLTYGKVRAMYDENGKQVKVAGPSSPVSILGFDAVPEAGCQAVVIDEKFSKKVIEERKNKIQVEKATKTSGVSLDDFMDKVNEGKLKSLNIIIKGDVQGSVEALKQSLTEIANDEARVVCLHSGAGSITESDILLASSSQAVVIGFNVKPQPKAKALAEQMKVEIKEYNIIYQAVDDLTLAINGMLTPKYEEITIGHAEIRAIFKLSSGVIAGCYITDGKAQRNAGARLMRDGETIVDTTIEALRIQKDDKAEVNYGYECGIKLKDFKEIKENDVLEIYIKQQIKR